VVDVRIAFLCAALLAAVSFCDVAMAQLHVPRVGLVGVRPKAEGMLSPTVQGFLLGMQGHGYVEGRDYVFEYRATLGNPERFADLTAELAHLPVDVLLVPVCGAPLNAARQASHTIPIVVATCNDDLIETGVIKSMAHPGGNVTGLSKLTPELAPKRLSLLKQTVPSIARVGVLWNPSYSAFTSDWRELREAAERMGVTLVPFEFRRADELEAAFAAIRRERLDAFITFSDVLVYVYAERVAKLAAEAQIPALFAFREVPDAGGLMSYGPNIVDMWRRSADYVVKILNGAKPDDIPIEQPTRLEFVINLKQAKALGITIPRAVRLQADYIIE
jgi:putative tryptophan/tyrosine transport system substrate-binding protein